MDVRNAYLTNTFRDQDDTDGRPLIIGVRMIDVGNGYGYVACFRLRYADAEIKYVPIAPTSLQRVAVFEVNDG